MTDKASRQESDYVARVKDILRQKTPLSQDTEILEFTKQLKQEKAFGYARRLLELTRESRAPEADEQVKLKFAQKYALCTYKDPDLPVSDRLDRALRILDAADALLETENQETLGLVGAIFDKTIMRVVHYRETLTDIATGVGMSLIGWILARIHLHVFDKWCLHTGKVRK